MSLPTDDLLSALHDGELNSAERAIVEQRLAASAEARRELSEIRQVSSLLKELPRGCLPAEFPRQVLQSIEREMLIPSPRTELSVGSDSDSSINSLRSRRWVGVAAVLTSAAGLLLLLRAVDDRPGQDNLARRSPVVTAPQSTMDVAVADSLTSDRDSTSLMSRRSGLAGGPEPSGALAKDLPSGGALPSLGSTSRETSNLRVDQLGLRDSQIGDVVSAMQTEGTEVAVVWLTVVDRQEGLAGLQLLLAEKPGARANAFAKKADKAAQPEDATDELHAVYVQSNPEQLAAALKQLRDENFLQRVEVGQPIEMAQLNDVRIGRFEVADKLKTDSAEARAARIDEAVKGSAGPLAAKSRVAQSEKSLAEKKLAGAAAASPRTAAVAADEAKRTSDAKEARAKPETFNLPLEALVQNQNLNQLNQQSRVRGTARNADQKPVAGEKNADKASADRRPMQVLFVVVDQSQAGKLQASPANSPKPAAPPAKTRTEPAKPADKDGAA